MIRKMDKKYTNFSLDVSHNATCIKFLKYIFFFHIKEYDLAVWQCYGRYLDQFGDQQIEDIVDIKTVKEIFFPDGLETDNASLTVSLQCFT